MFFLLRESLGYTKLMGAQPCMQAGIVNSTYRATELHYTFGCTTLSAAYFFNPSLQNYCFTKLMAMPPLGARYVSKLYQQNLWVSLLL